MKFTLEDCDLTVTRTKRGVEIYLQKDGEDCWRESFIMANDGDQFTLKGLSISVTIQTMDPNWTEHAVKGALRNPVEP